MKGSDVPTAILMHWYVCGRKVAFESEAEAREARPWREHFYPCPHGDHWHAASRPPMPEQTNARRQTRRRNAAKAWDRQAYR